MYGYDGNGICLINKVGKLGKGPYYLQEYIANNCDYRIFVIKGKSVGAIVRRSDSLAHNIHQGGIGIPCEIDSEMDEIAGEAAEAVGVDYGGVDLLKDGEGYTVLEVNGTPNWHCMSAPIPKLLAKYLIMKERQSRTELWISCTFRNFTIDSIVVTLSNYLEISGIPALLNC